MGYEVEFKAHVADNQIEELKEVLGASFTYIDYLKKNDEYYAESEDAKPLFRIRTENDKIIYVTSKPEKSKLDGLEVNTENEFSVCFNQLEKLRKFAEGLNLMVCRRKYKEGYEYKGQFNCFNLHIELLNVRYLGWFLEVEILSYKGSDAISCDKDKIQDLITDLLSFLKISRSSLESMGYHKMLKACGHGLS